MIFLSIVIIYKLFELEKFWPPRLNKIKLGILLDGPVLYLFLVQFQKHDWWNFLFRKFVLCTSLVFRRQQGFIMFLYCSSLIFRRRQEVKTTYAVMIPANSHNPWTEINQCHNPINNHPSILPVFLQN